MAASNSATVHVTDDSFAGEIEQADGLVLVDFWASWCGPCQIVAPVLDQLAGEYAGKVRVGKVNTDENPQVAASHNISSIPTLLLFKGGQVVDKTIGVMPKDKLAALLDKHVAPTRLA